MLQLKQTEEYNVGYNWINVFEFTTISTIQWKEGQVENRRALLKNVYHFLMNLWNMKTVEGIESIMTECWISI